VTREFTPSPDKADNKLDPNQPDTREPVYTNDILGNNAVLDLMVNLIDNAQQEAIGIAFGNPRDFNPELGFEFRFSKTINSVGYSSTEVEAYSVLKLRMDIRPIQLRSRCTATAERHSGILMGRRRDRRAPSHFLWSGMRMAIKFLFQPPDAAMPLAAAGAAPAAPGRQGLAGHHRRRPAADNDAVWQRIVALAGGPARASRCCLGRGRPGAGGAAIVEFPRYGADAFQVPLAVKLADSDYRQAADDPLLADAVRSAGGVFFSGGDQARITQALVREDGSRSAVLDAVWELYRAAAWWPATAPARPS
jgi:hypothetical protein